MELKGAPSGVELIARRVLNLINVIELSEIIGRRRGAGFSPLSSKLMSDMPT